MPSHHNRSSKAHSAGVVASATLLLAQGATAAFNAADNVAVYWGQNSYNQASGNLAQQSLADYCANSNIDIIPMSFLVQVTTGQGGQPVINLANAGNNCTLFPDSALLDCPQIGEDIKTCQDTYNKTVLLSIGGATYTEGGFASEDEAVKAANLIWETFGPANSSGGNMTVTGGSNSSSVLSSSSSISSGQNRTAHAAASTPTLDYDPQDPLWAVSLLAKLTQTAGGSKFTTKTLKGPSAERTANPKESSTERSNNPTAALAIDQRNSSTTLKKQKKSTIYQTHTDYATNNRVATIIDPTGTRFIPPGRETATMEESARKTPHLPKIRMVNYDGTHNLRRQSPPSPPSTILRPFHDAAVDGFDLDIEAPGQNFPAFANRLRALMDAEKKASSKKDKNFYLTAAPQCPYPDLNNDAMLNGGVAFDALFVQFYNNYCGVQSFVPTTNTNITNSNTTTQSNTTINTTTKQTNFNFETWHNWATQNSSNPSVKIFLGVPAGQSAAGSGYTSLSNLEPVIAYSQTFSSFGGVMAWDASQAYANGGFLKGVKDVLRKGTTPSTPTMGKAAGSSSSSSTTTTAVARTNVVLGKKRRGVRRVERQPWWA